MAAGAQGEGLRRRVARGTLVNAGFLAAVNVLTVARGFVVAALLSRTEYGLWGMLAAALAMLTWFRQAGLLERFVQYGGGDEEREYQRAVTLELLLGSAFALAGAIVIPLTALATGVEDLVAPGLVLCLALPGMALQAPQWIYYRRLDFVRQRVLQAVDPVAAFLVTVPLAIAGAGAWSLVIGTVAGAWISAAVSLVASPYSLRLRFERSAARSYASFSWPLFLAGATGVVFGQGLSLVGETTVGLAGVGVIALSAVLTQFATRLDQIITQTIYPAICAVQDRLAVLEETFATSNRLAMLWGVPFGLGLALFADPLIMHVFGARWRPAIGLLEVTGVIAAVHQIAFNWDAFYRARGDTRPTGVGAVVAMLSFLALPLPLLAVDGLRGLAIGLAGVEAVSLVLRCHYVRRLFPALRLVRHVARAWAPSLAAAAVVALWRAAGLPSTETAAGAAVQLAVFVAALAAGVAVFERSLLREVRGYLRPPALAA